MWLVFFTANINFPFCDLHIVQRCKSDDLTFCFDVARANTVLLVFCTLMKRVHRLSQDFGHCPPTSNRLSLLFIRIDLPVNH